MDLNRLGRAQFAVFHDTPLSTEAAWAKVTDWPRHGRYVPLTRVTVPTAPPNGVGTVFVARTSVGPLGFDDPMEIVGWSPPAAGGPGSCRLEKRGRVMLGWAVLTVQPLDGEPGSRVSWREAARPAALPAFADPVAAVAGRALFGRVLRHLVDD